MMRNNFMDTSQSWRRLTKASPAPPIPIMISCLQQIWMNWCGDHHLHIDCASHPVPVYKTDHSCVSPALNSHDSRLWPGYVKPVFMCINIWLIAVEVYRQNGRSHSPLKASLTGWNIFLTPCNLLQHDATVVYICWTHSIPTIFKYCWLHIEGANANGHRSHLWGSHSWIFLSCLETEVRNTQTCKHKAYALVFSVYIGKAVTQVELQICWFRGTLTCSKDPHSRRTVTFLWAITYSQVVENEPRDSSADSA